MDYPRTLSSHPLTISASVESQVYLLFAVAMGLTVAGVALGATFALPLLNSGFMLLFLIAELAIIFTSRLWMDKSPLNVILFGAFPFLSGLTITPYLMAVSAGYVNGDSILFNALAATTFMALTAGVFAKTTSWNLAGLGRFLLFAVLGLIGFGILQLVFALWFPAMLSDSFELLLSGAGVVIFALFTAYDVQRVQEMSRYGANPFLLALSLYLDIFNLFLYVLRFMVALSGERR